MPHNQYDRFQGCWWGAIVAQSSIERFSIEPQISNYSQPWLAQRQKLATMLLERELSVLNLQKLADLPPSNTALQHNSSLLSFLPSIVFFPDDPIVGLRKMLDWQNTADEQAKIEISQYILVWEYLLTTVLNDRFKPNAHKRVIEEVIKRHPQPELLAKLTLVSEAIKNGSSLNLVVKQLSTMKEHESSAIALAWYCFATTPQDFKLSVRRAIRVPSKLAWLVTALTGTLSGAYNGMAEISAYSRQDMQNQKELEQHLCEKLFADWLGILNYDSHDLAHNPNLNAIALTRIIQPRQSLKIISQVSNLK